MKSSSRLSGKVSALILFALFILALVMALVAGARAYSALVNNQSETNNQRLADNIVVNAIRSGDCFDGVSVADGPQGPALVLTEHTLGGVFENRFFLEADGVLYQQYCLADAPFSSTSATPIVATDTFDFIIDGPLISLTTDQGHAWVTLRSAYSGEGD